MANNNGNLEEVREFLFFIAETKGIMETLNLRPIEKAKIDCARTFRGLGYRNRTLNKKIVYMEICKKLGYNFDIVSI